METNEINRKMREIGVSDPSNPTEKEIRVILEKFTNKELDPELFNSYLNIQDISPKDLINGIKDMVNSNKDISKMLMELCDKIIDVYKDDLVKAKTPEESKQIREEIFNVLNTAREETDSFKTSTVMMLAIFAIVIGGGGVLLAKKMLGNSI